MIKVETVVVVVCELKVIDMDVAAEVKMVRVQHILETAII